MGGGETIVVSGCCHSQRQTLNGMLIIINAVFMFSSNGRVQQTQLLRSGSVNARCYWCILLDHPIAASAHATVESAERDQ